MSDRIVVNAGSTGRVKVSKEFGPCAMFGTVTEFDGDYFDLQLKIKEDTTLATASAALHELFKIPKSLAVKIIVELEDEE